MTYKEIIKIVGGKGETITETGEEGSDLHGIGVCKLPHYDRSQTGEYMARHLAYAGSEQAIFSDNALDVIYTFSRGAARLINKVATNSLIYGAVNQKRIIDDHMGKRVIEGELV